MEKKAGSERERASERDRDGKQGATERDRARASEKDRDRGRGRKRERNCTLPIIIHVEAGGRVVLVRWWYASRLRTTTGPFARWRSESTVVRLAARGQAYARTAPFFTRLLSPVGGYRRWSAAGAGIGGLPSAHAATVASRERKKVLSCPRPGLASPLFFFFLLRLATCPCPEPKSARTARRVSPADRSSPSPSFPTSFHSIRR